MLLRSISSVFVVVTIAAMSPAYADPDRTALLQSESISEINRIFKNSSLGGIKVGMSEQQVRRILGRPLKIRRSQYGQCGDDATKHVEYIYRNLRVYFNQADPTAQIKVETIATTDRRYQTDKGIRVGDAISTAKAAYPNLELTPRGTWLTNTSRYDLKIDKQGKITEIVLGYSDGC
jgi:hypothetical protein